MSPSNPARRSLLPFIVAGLACVLAGSARPAAAQPAATAEPAAGVPAIPPLPKGTPAELMQFIEGLKNNDVRPKSRQEMMSYMKSLAGVTVEAANTILPQVKDSDPLYAQAATMKLESLMMLGRLGDEAAAQEMATFAATPRARMSNWPRKRSGLCSCRRRRRCFQPAASRAVTRSSKKLPPCSPPIRTT